MNSRTLKITGFTIVLLLVLGVGVAAAGLNTSGAGATAKQEADAEAGVIVASVAPDGPAASAGVVRGDILLAINDQSVDRTSDVGRILRELQPGAEVELSVLHGDDLLTHTATLDERRGQAHLGLSPCCGQRETIFEHLPLEGLQDMGSVIIDVIPDSPADEAGLQQGDRVLSVDGEELGPESDLADALRAYAPGDSVTLEVQRRGEDEPISVTVNLGEHPDDASRAYLGVHYSRSHMRIPGIPDFRQLPLDPEHFFSPNFKGPDFRFFGSPFEGDFFQFPFEGENIQGVIIRDLIEDSPASNSDLRQGDVITAVDGEPVEGAREFTEAIAARQPGETVTLTVLRPDADEEAEIEIEVQLGERPDDATKGFLGVSVGGFLHMQRSFEDGEHGQFGPFMFRFDFDGPRGEFPGFPDRFPFNFEHESRPSPSTDL